MANILVMHADTSLHVHITKTLNSFMHRIHMGTKSKKLFFQHVPERNSTYRHKKTYVKADGQYCKSLHVSNTAINSHLEKHNFQLLSSTQHFTHYRDVQVETLSHKFLVLISLCTDNFALEEMRQS